VLASRAVVALITGGAIYLATLHRLLSYSQRNKLGTDRFYTFAALVLIAAAIVTAGMHGKRYRTAGFLILGVWAVHAIAIVIDTHQDPTTHNLLPFEFIILGVLALPSYIGAGISHVIGYITAPRTPEP
jgi:hypothetical protein